MSQTNTSNARNTTELDYVVIGSGSAGSTIAYRLGEDLSHKILVLEFGGTDIGPFIQMPAALSYPMNMARYDWGYKAEAEDSLNGRSLVCPRGKVIGGSSSINGMIYVRGHAGDYNYWQDSGAKGWSYADILPYFKNGKLRMAVRPLIAARMGLYILPEARVIILCMMSLSKPLNKQVIAQPQIIMAIVKRVWGLLI